MILINLNSALKLINKRSFLVFKMDSTSIGSITTEDLQALREMMINALNESIEENSDNKIDTTKFVDQVENEIRKKIEIVYPQTDQNKVQELKDSVEKMELKAQRMKNQLLIHRNRFIEDVRTNIETELNSKIPVCTEINLDAPVFLSDEDLKKLNILDERISSFEKKLEEVERRSKESLPDIEQFFKQTNSAFSKN